MISPRIVAVALAIVMPLTACSKMSLEAKVTGVKPGEPTVLIVHVKTGKGATVQCTVDGLGCHDQEFRTGEGDLEIDLQGPNVGKPKIAYLKAKIGPREASLTLDLATTGLPPSLVALSGALSCTARPCEGSLTMGPLPHLHLQTPVGTSAELGGQHFSADAKGVIDAPITLTMHPALNAVPLTILCAEKPTSLGSTPLSLTFADKIKVTADVAMTTEQASRGVMDALAPVSKGPVLLPGEKAGSAPIARGQRAALYLGPLTCSFAGPTGATLPHVAVVAVGVGQTRADTCEYNASNAKTGAATGSKSGKLTLDDENVTAYSRLTGEKLGTRLFHAPKTCAANFTLESGGSIREQYAFVDGAVIAAWALTQSK